MSNFCGRKKAVNKGIKIQEFNLLLNADLPVPIGQWLQFHWLLAMDAGQGLSPLQHHYRSIKIINL